MGSMLFDFVCASVYACYYVRISDLMLFRSKAR